MAVSGKAAAGDVEATRYLRDTAGEKPREGLELGNLDDKPLASLDMSKLTDEQLRIIAARRAEKDSSSEGRRHRLLQLVAQSGGAEPAIH